MRSRTLLTSFALLAIAGVAGAQGTTKKATKPMASASAVPTSAKMSAPADTTQHAVKKSSRRRHRNAAKAAATDTAAKAAPAAKAKSTTKKP
jgi:hypothetical protein